MGNEIVEARSGGLAVSQATTTRTKFHYLNSHQSRTSAQYLAARRVAAAAHRTKHLRLPIPAEAWRIVCLLTGSYPWTGLTPVAALSYAPAASQHRYRSQISPSTLLAVLSTVLPSTRLTASDDTMLCTIVCMQCNYTINRDYHSLLSCRLLKLSSTARDKDASMQPHLVLQQEQAKRARLPGHAYQG
jgi:hypothetical protein